MSSSQILQHKTKDRWWIKTSGESQPLTASRNVMEFNTWKREGCTVVDSPLRGSHPPQPRWHHGVCAVQVHLQVWRDATQELGECCYCCSVMSHKPLRWFNQILSNMHTLQKIHKAFSSSLWFKDVFHNNFLSDFQNYLLPEMVLWKGFSLLYDLNIIFFKNKMLLKFAEL